MLRLMGKEINAFKVNTNDPYLDLYVSKVIFVVDIFLLSPVPVIIISILRSAYAFIEHMELI